MAQETIRVAQPWVSSQDLCLSSETKTFQFHSFLRFTSSDDCTIQFGYCQHNRKQTHYHCIQNKCDKTYISTSDVQMHSNYHRKDSAIYQEGFQRYRATEKCLVQHCIFYGQCTTHFHCRRCKYTFKNKADMGE